MDDACSVFGCYLCLETLESRLSNVAKSKTLTKHKADSTLAVLVPAIVDAVADTVRGTGTR